MKIKYIDKYENIVTNQNEEIRDGLLRKWNKVLCQYRLHSYLDWDAFTLEHMCTGDTNDGVAKRYLEKFCECVGTIRIHQRGVSLWKNWQVQYEIPTTFEMCYKDWPRLKGFQAILCTLPLNDLAKFQIFCQNFESIFPEWREFETSRHPRPVHLC